MRNVRQIAMIFTGVLAAIGVIVLGGPRLPNDKIANTVQIAGLVILFASIVISWRFGKQSLAKQDEALRVQIGADDRVRVATAFAVLRDPLLVLQSERLYFERNTSEQRLRQIELLGQTFETLQEMESFSNAFFALNAPIVRVHAAIESLSLNADLAVLEVGRYAQKYELGGRWEHAARRAVDTLRLGSSLLYFYLVGIETEQRELPTEPQAAAQTLRNNCIGQIDESAITLMLRLRADRPLDDWVGLQQIADKLLREPISWLNQLQHGLDERDDRSAGLLFLEN